MSDSYKTTNISKTFYRRHLPHQVQLGHPLFITWNLKGAFPKHVYAELEEQQRRLEQEPFRAGESLKDREIRHGKILFAARDQWLDKLAAEAERACGAGGVAAKDERLESTSGFPAGHSAESGWKAKHSAMSGWKAGRTDNPNVRQRLTCQGRPVWLRDPRAAKTVIESLLWGVPERYELLAWAVMPNHVHVLLIPLVELGIITQGIKGWTSYQINRQQNQTGRQFWQNESFDHWARDDDEALRIIEYIENNPVEASLCKLPEQWPWSSAYWRERLGWKYGEHIQANWKDELDKELERVVSGWNG